MAQRPTSVLIIGIVLSIGLGQWACRERTLQVLEPIAKAPVPSNAPPGGAGAPNADAGINPDAAIAECSTGLKLGADCSTSNDCCSGNCGPTPTGNSVCLPTVGCWGAGTRCYGSGDCCSLACITSDSGHACADLGVCVPKGGTCTSGTDCCSSLCDAGNCAESAPPACLPAGELCVGAADCCSTVCAPGGDGKSRCQLLTACRVVGEICAAASSCCSDICQTSPSGISRCGAAKACIMGDAKGCTRQVGDLCKNPDECCSRSCVAQTDGSMRCSSVAACRAGCETCKRSQDCCSGNCVADAAEGISRCTLIGCGTEGEVCLKNEDCCQADFAQKCVEEPPGQKSKRCRRDVAETECLAAGEACALGSRCCSGICAQDAAWGFRCALVPVPEAQPCGNRADCSLANSACVSLFGERLCYVVSVP